MADEILTSPEPHPPTTAWAAVKRLVSGVSLSRIQSVVATLAGIATVTGVALSLMQFARPETTGQLVAIVQAAGSHRSVADATVEVLTTQDALVATLTPNSAGRATQELREGVYVVRVSHPRYATDVHRVQVVPRQTIEIRANLRGGSSPPIERALNKGVGAVRRALGF